LRDKSQLLKIIKALRNAKELKNIIRLGDENMQDLLQKVDFNLLNVFLAETQRQLDKLNLIDSINNEQETQNLLNVALEDIWFSFVKVSENELILADEQKGQMRKSREAMQRNIDQLDPQFITLREELENIFKKKNLEEITQEGMKENIHLLKSIYDRVLKLNQANENLQHKYLEDDKYVRIHKRLTEKGDLNLKQTALYEALIKVKEQTDEQILHNSNIVDNDAYFKKYLMSLVINEFKKNSIVQVDFETTKQINQLIVAEYQQQYNGYKL
jgi:type I restriction enzyme R subunit